jgi:hypothetical protein
MFKFYFLDDDIERNRSFHSNTNTLYYDNLSIFLFTFATQIFPIDELLLKPYN